MIITSLIFHFIWEGTLNSKLAYQNHEISLTFIWKSLSSVLQDLTPILTKILTSDPYNPEWVYVVSSWWVCSYRNAFDDCVVWHSLQVGQLCLNLLSAFEIVHPLSPWPVWPEGHRLVLEVALPSLVTDGAIQGVVDQEELHHSLPGLPGELAVGLDLPTIHHRHSASSHRLGTLLNLHKTHSAVASDGETVMVAKTRNLNADHGRGLQNSGACVRGNVISIVITGLNQNLTSFSGRSFKIWWTSLVTNSILFCWL